MKPFYQHKCSTCVYLDRVEVNQKIYDLYYCSGQDNFYGNTVIARFGNGISDYISGIFASIYNPVLALAVTKALNKNLLSYESFKAHTIK